MYNKVIKFSLDTVSYKTKPDSNEIRNKINPRIAGYKIALKTYDDIIEFVNSVNKEGYTFCPATFINGIRDQEHFDQMQLLVLDFDETISWKDVEDRAEFYTLPILFAYESFSSKNQNRFRVVFLHNEPIIDKRWANICVNALITIFPEADPCSKDIARLFFGANNKKLLYINNSYPQSFPTINTETLLRNMSHYLEDIYGPKHYKEHIKKFAEKHRIRLNYKGLLDITTIEDVTEYIGANQNGKNSPWLLIYNSGGDVFPNLTGRPPTYYKLNLISICTHNCSVAKKPINHREYRGYSIFDLCSGCPLLSDFVSGSRKLEHSELFGIASNMIYLEAGDAQFINILSSYQNLYKSSKLNDWKRHFRYIRDHNYHKQSCINFCEYSGISCKHGANILSTVLSKPGTMEKLADYEEKYDTLDDVQKDVEKKIKGALEYNDGKWQIIKAQTAIGKTEVILKLLVDMQKQGKRCIIAVPTNDLKNEVCNRAINMGIDAKKTPSLNEINDEMPKVVWDYISHLLETGEHQKVHPYIQRIADELNIECLKQYLKQINEYNVFKGHIITTHRKLLTMTKKYINRFYAVIIDEDIILNSIIPNQCIIPISLLKQTSNDILLNEKYQGLSNKIKTVFKAIGAGKKLFKLPSISSFQIKKRNDSENDEDLLSINFDIKSFCSTKHFMFVGKSNRYNTNEDSIIFFKPFSFKNIEKTRHIMLSATVNKTVCEYCFGKENVNFTECKTAAYKGYLNQFYEYSMSRAFIGNSDEIIQKITEWSGVPEPITFKKYEISKDYFGTAIGRDHLKGKDINIIGTPHKPDFLYKLLAFSMDFDVDESAMVKPCQVRHNGYQFRFTTFDEKYEGLRKIQFWIIESELEQAVGRARLLRNDCTVNLFSNFPLKQAIMKEYPNELQTAISTVKLGNKKTKRAFMDICGNSIIETNYKTEYDKCNLSTVINKRQERKVMIKPRYAY
jgi:hypothetical protein